MREAAMGGKKVMAQSLDLAAEPTQGGCKSAELTQRLGCSASTARTHSLYGSEWRVQSPQSLD